MAWQLARVVLVVILLGLAAALVTPPGRLPLALRGVLKIMRRDRGVAEAPAGAKAPGWRRFVGFLLVLVAAMLALAG